MRRDRVGALCFSLAVCLMAGIQAIPSWGQDTENDYRAREFERADFSDAYFRWCDLTKTRIQDCKLSGWRVENSSGDATSWERVGLQRPALSNVSLTGAKWSRGSLSGRLEHVQLPGLQLYRCDGRDIQITSATLDDLTLERLTLRDLEMEYVEVRGGEFNSVTARYSRWRNANLQSSNLERVDLGYARLNNCDLSSARLDRCDLRNARLNNCDLSSARLDRCDLRNARLDNCEIRGLRINGHDIEELIRRAGR